MNTIINGVEAHTVSANYKFAFVADEDPRTKNF